jgi:hypothetical protein
MNYTFVREFFQDCNNYPRSVFGVCTAYNIRYGNLLTIEATKNKLDAMVNAGLLVNAGNDHFLGQLYKLTPIN